jgi:hypothetical protein
MQSPCHVAARGAMPVRVFNQIVAASAFRIPHRLLAGKAGKTLREMNCFPCRCPATGCNQNDRTNLPERGASADRSLDVVRSSANRGGGLNRRQQRERSGTVGRFALPRG